MFCLLSGFSDSSEAHREFAVLPGCDFLPSFLLPTANNGYIEGRVRGGKHPVRGRSVYGFCFLTLLPGARPFATVLAAAAIL